MYDPWYPTDSSTADIIKLIEEKERKEAKNGGEPSNWDIMRLRDVSANEKAKSSRFVDHDSSRRPRRPEKSERSVSTAEGSRRREAAPADRWGQAVAESFDKQPRSEGETVAWKVNRRSNSPEVRDSLRSRRGQRSPDSKMNRDRSRSGSGDRKRKRLHSRSRSGSMPKVRSRSREAKRDRSGSREKRRHRSVSRDRQHKKSDRRRSSSNDAEKRDPSPRKRIKTNQPTPDNSVTADIFSQFISIMKDVKEKQAQSDKKEVPDHKINVLPEFDPNNKGHAMVTWLIRVDDVAKLFGWSEKEILQHSLPKLVGDAKTWYQTLTTVPFSWSEWKKMLLEQFPCPNFAELLMEMSNRHALPTETLEQYFYAKVPLLNRCGFKGRQAVDCLLQGIETDAIRLCARAADFAEPEELLVYLKSAEPLRQISKTLPPTTSATATATANTAQEAPEKMYNPICYICGLEGHKAAACSLKKHQQAMPKGAGSLPQIPMTITEPLPPTPETTSTTPTASRNTGQEAPKDKKYAICYACGKMGHKAHGCRFKKQQQSANVRPPFVQMNPTQLRMRNDLIRGPRPSQQIRPENQYVKPIFAKRCHKCKEIGHVAPMCRARSFRMRKEAAAAAAAGPPQDNAENQPAPPGLED